LNGDATVFLGTFAIAMVANAYLMGGILLGESRDISERVRRTLPRTFLVRMLFTWFYPGPGSGLLFAISNLLAVSMTVALFFGALLLVAQVDLVGTPFPNSHWQFLFEVGYMAISYAVFFLALGNAILTAFGRFVPRSRALSAALQTLLVLGGVAIPALIEGLFIRQAPTRFWLLHVSNPYAGMEEVFKPRAFAIRGQGSALLTSVERDKLLWIVPLAAFALLLANLPLVLAEVRHKRLAKPVRVVEDDDEVMARERPAPRAVIKSPWDEP
jgi:hypothetical protein